MVECEKLVQVVFKTFQFVYPKKKKKRREEE
jgi:hypothetical protein